MIAATALVLLMTLPGLALFYSGMVRSKNILATMAQSVAATAVVSLLWFAGAYSLAFTRRRRLIGSLAAPRSSTASVSKPSTPSPATIPELLFMAYQMTFAVITCALVGGAVADRMKFSAFFLFCVVWLFIVYVPSAHWVWGGGFLGAMGLIDFAGGTVVHINAGIAGLTAVADDRRTAGLRQAKTWRLSICRWPSWALACCGSAGSASTAARRWARARAPSSPSSRRIWPPAPGPLVWSGIEWIKRGKPSVLGVISGAVAGLGTITPASGYVLPWHGLVIGVIAGGVCYWFCTVVKQDFKYDNSLDVFGVHGDRRHHRNAAGRRLRHGRAERRHGRPKRHCRTARGQSAPARHSGNRRRRDNRLVRRRNVDHLEDRRRVCKLRVSADEEREGLDLSQHGEALHQSAHFRLLRRFCSSDGSIIHMWTASLRKLTDICLTHPLVDTELLTKRIKAQKRRMSMIMRICHRSICVPPQRAGSFAETFADIFARQHGGIGRSPRGFSELFGDRRHGAFDDDLMRVIEDDGDLGLADFAQMTDEKRITATFFSPGVSVKKHR